MDHNHIQAIRYERKGVGVTLSAFCFVGFNDRHMKRSVKSLTKPFEELIELLVSIAVKVLWWTVRASTKVIFNLTVSLNFQLIKLVNLVIPEAKINQSLRYPYVVVTFDPSLTGEKYLRSFTYLNTRDDLKIGDEVIVRPNILSPLPFRATVSDLLVESNYDGRHMRLGYFLFFR